MNKNLAKSNTKTVRNSSIELLRIFSMLFIVFHHFSVHGGFNFPHTSLSLSRFWVSLFGMGGKFGVDVFVLISGYFLISDAKPLNFKRVLKTWGQVFFYSALFCLISLASTPPSSV